MSTLFAFLHHLCAFTLVAALAVEFTLIRQELTLASARRLQTTDLVLGISAGAARKRLERARTTLRHWLDNDRHASGTIAG